ncbi:MAG: hypothetical protein ABIQ93_11915, partial [Saprospiraceae bacterium]
ILKKALHVLADTSSSQSMIQQIRRQLLDFENIGCFEPTLADFERIRPSRKTEPYRKALLLAKMILLHFVPDVQQGRDHVLAILFDMNLLFERYVYRQLQKHHDVDPNYEVSFSAQESKDFWGRQTIRPDIIATITHLLSKVSNTFIIDTKWKILSDLRPADTDLKQMFAYNLHWKSTHAILLYPSVGQANTARIRYSQADAAPDFEHHCALCFADLVNSDGVLKKGFGRDFILENLLLGRE